MNAQHVFDGMIALTVEGREGQDEGAEDDTADEDALTGAGHPGQFVFGHSDGAGEMNGAKAGDHTHGEIVWQVGIADHIDMGEVEQDHVAEEEACGEDGSDGCHQERDQAQRRQGDHEDLEGKEDAGDGCVKDSCCCGGGAARQQEGSVSHAQPEKRGKVGTPCAAGGHDRGFQTERTAKPHGKAAAHHVGVGVLDRNE